jgi:hypothetical protein
VVTVGNFTLSFTKIALMIQCKVCVPTYGRFFWRRFIRLRIEVDITKPLIPGVFLPRPELNDLWIGLKYEKLPEVCFRCGLIGHDSRFCGANHRKLSNQFGEKFIAYGPWLRSENELTPPGIYDRSSNLEASNSYEETPATRRESEQENSQSTRQDNQETAKLKEDNKKSNRQNEVEQQNGITSLARLMAEALQADCSVGVHDAEEETNLTILATKQQVSIVHASLAHTHKHDILDAYPTPIPMGENSLTDTIHTGPLTQTENLIAQTQPTKNPNPQTKPSPVNLTPSPDPCTSSISKPQPTKKQNRPSQEIQTNPSPHNKPKWKVRARSNPNNTSENPSAPIPLHVKRKKEHHTDDLLFNLEPHVSKIRRIDEAQNCLSAAAAEQPR